MYVLLDRDALVFRHKHHDKEIINALCHIEMAHCHSTVYRVDTACRFPDLTDLDLRLIYKHSTGHKFDGFSHQHLIEMVLGVARAIPETDAGRDAIAQAAQIGPKDKCFYRYVKGSKEPQQLAELYHADPAVADLQAVEAQAAAAKAAPAEPDPVPAKAMPLTTAPAAPKGGSRPTIFAVADKMWDAAGKPTDVQVVLTLRKAIMAELEANHEIKKTTSSTALGEWQKAKLQA